jgi:Cutinase
MRTGYPTRGVVSLVLFAAATLTFTRPAAPITQAALVPVTASAGCPAAEIIGVHGTGEGPSRTNGTYSPEIKATFSAFAADEQKLGEHSARLEYFTYPTFSFAAYLPVNWPALRIIIGQYARELEAELEHFSRSCPDTPVSLVGYSFGALLINDMLTSYRKERSFLDAVELYGDPCWYSPRRDYRGLARYAATAGLRLGCPSGNAYPYPLARPDGFHFLVQSLCNNKDPICGRGWPLYEIDGQIIAAALCAVYNCPHRSYVGTAVNYGAEFLAENAFKQAGGDG